MSDGTLITDGGTTTATETTAETTTSTTAATGETTQGTANDANPPAGETGDKGGDAGNVTETDQQRAERTAAEAAAEAAKAAGAPEKYEPFTAPEGAALDPAVMTEFEVAARELNLPQDAAQKLVDKMAPVMAKQQAAQVEQLRNDWAAASTSDKEFGGEKLAENLGYARKAMDTFGTPELKAMLNDTGLGNHPDVVRFMVRAGKAMSEDRIVTGGAPASANRSAADVLYGSTASKK